MLTFPTLNESSLANVSASAALKPVMVLVTVTFAVPATGVNLSRVNLTLSIKFPTVASLDAVLPATKKKRVEY